METIQAMLDELWTPGIWTGWAAFLIFIPLAITSNDTSQRLMRKAWKQLQRWVYPAAVCRAHPLHNGLIENMKKLLLALILTSLPLQVSLATGLHQCDSGDQTNWKTPESLKDKLILEGWKVRKIKQDGGCYEVYAKNPSNSFR